MKFNNLLFLPLIFTSTLNNLNVQAANIECLQNCEEMFSYANTMCCKSLPFFAASGNPLIFLTSSGCFAAAAVAYGICLGFCSSNG